MLEHILRLVQCLGPPQFSKVWHQPKMIGAKYAGHRLELGELPGGAFWIGCFGSNQPTWPSCWCTDKIGRASGRFWHHLKQNKLDYIVYQSIRLFIHPSIHSWIHSSSIDPFIHYPLIHSSSSSRLWCIRSSIHPFIHPFVHLHIHSLIQWFIDSVSLYVQDMPMLSEHSSCTSLYCVLTSRDASLHIRDVIAGWAASRRRSGRGSLAVGTLAPGTWAATNHLGVSLWCTNSNHFLQGNSGEI